MRSLFSGSSLAKAASENVILKIFNHKTKQVVTIKNPSSEMLRIANMAVGAAQKFEMINKNPAYCFYAFGLERGDYLMSQFELEAKFKGKTLKMFIDQYCTPSETNKITKWLRT